VSPVSHVLIIARREFLERARSRVFIVTMASLAVLIVGGIFAISFIGGGQSAVPLGVAGNSPEGLVGDIQLTATALEAEVTVQEYPDRAAAVAAIETGDIDAALIDGSTIVAEQAPSSTVTAIFTAAANSAVRREKAAELGLSQEEVAAIVAPVQVSVEELAPEQPDQVARQVASFLAALVLLTTIMIFGQFVAMGIVEEKQNRVVEVILSKVRTTSLLVGKVVGIGALGLVQIGALGIAVVLGLVLAPLPDLGVPSLTSIGVSAVIWLVFWFILGYMVYSFVYATLGATISRQEDMQSVAFIPAMAILPAYFMVTLTSSTGGEVSPLVRIASFVPLWSPILMPMRISVGDATPWEVALAVALAMGAVFLLVRIGARVYRGAALRTAGRVSLRQAWASADE
jgi:ABC-2 type transport system permease protein